MRKFRGVKAYDGWAKSLRRCYTEKLNSESKETERPGGTSTREMSGRESKTYYKARLFLSVLLIKSQFLERNTYTFLYTSIEPNRTTKVNQYKRIKYNRGSNNLLFLTKESSSKYIKKKSCQILNFIKIASLALIFKYL